MTRKLIKNLIGNQEQNDFRFQLFKNEIKYKSTYIMKLNAKSPTVRSWAAASDHDIANAKIRFDDVDKWFDRVMWDSENRKYRTDIENKTAEFMTLMRDHTKTSSDWKYGTMFDKNSGTNFTVDVVVCWNMTTNDLAYHIAGAEGFLTQATLIEKEQGKNKPIIIWYKNAGETK